MSRTAKLSARPRLTSAGAQTSGRARLERLLLSNGERVLTAFLDDVRQMAGRGDFTQGHVLGAWSTAVKELASSIELDPSAVQRLLGSRLPGDVYQTLTTVMHTSREQGWPSARLSAELRLAFDPQTGTRERLASGELEDVGMSWKHLFERTARTESTATYSRYTESALAASGIARKRWVAHYDETTRTSHAEASGQTVALGAEFLVGGVSIAWPGDPSAPFSETMNCRCVMVGVR